MGMGAGGGETGERKRLRVQGWGLGVQVARLRRVLCSPSRPTASYAAHCHWCPSNAYRPLEDTLMRVVVPTHCAAYWHGVLYGPQSCVISILACCAFRFSPEQDDERPAGGRMNVDDTDPLRVHT